MTEQDSFTAGSLGGAVSGACMPVPSPDYYLHSDAIYVSATPCTILTILGSCVAVCLWDPTLGVGGMNHYPLPHPFHPEVKAGRFGSTAIQLLIERLEVLGCRRRHLRAKVFGGALISGLDVKGGLGRRNVEVALATLEREGIPLLMHDVGGRLGRKVLFHTPNGAAWVKTIGDGTHGTQR